jgi:hypothetical protein
MKVLSMILETLVHWYVKIAQKYIKKMYKENGDWVIVDYVPERNQLIFISSRVGGGVPYTRKSPILAAARIKVQLQQNIKLSTARLNTDKVNMVLILMPSMFKLGLGKLKTFLIKWREANDKVRFKVLGLGDGKN